MVLPQLLPLLFLLGLSMATLPSPPLSCLSPSFLLSDHGVQWAPQCAAVHRVADLCRPGFASLSHLAVCSLNVFLPLRPSPENFTKCWWVEDPICLNIRFFKTGFVCHQFFLT
jgi:hypothetical protein